MALDKKIYIHPDAPFDMTGVRTLLAMIYTKPAKAYVEREPSIMAHMPIQPDPPVGPYTMTLESNDDRIDTFVYIRSGTTPRDIMGALAPFLEAHDPPYYIYQYGYALESFRTPELYDSYMATLDMDCTTRPITGVAFTASHVPLTQPTQ